MRKQTEKNITVDSISVGLSVGAILVWLLNAVDLGLFQPLTYNIWRKLAGAELLPINYAKTLGSELFAFNRWWLVLFLAVGLTAFYAVTAKGGHASPRARAGYVGGGAFLVFAIVNQLYVIPHSATGAYDWLAHFFFDVVAGAITLLIVAPLIRKSMLRFMV
ncbi:MAG: hypothetical protein ACHQ50_05700 [Fimbriimonadales bacterium]